ncbi:hypothetical protein EB001_17100 [bacterium]|nr:hypothetical protein [bacterium]
MSHIVVNLNNSHETNLTYNAFLPFVVDFVPEPLDSPNCARLAITQEYYNTLTRRKVINTTILTTDTYITYPDTNPTTLICSFTKESGDRFRLSYYASGFTDVASGAGRLSPYQLYDKATISYDLFIFDKDLVTAPNQATGLLFSRPIYGKLINLGNITPVSACSRT